MAKRKVTKKPDKKAEDKKPVVYLAEKGFHTADGIRFEAGTKIPAEKLTDHEIKTLSAMDAISEVKE